MLESTLLLHTAFLLETLMSSVMLVAMLLTVLLTPNFPCRKLTWASSPPIAGHLRAAAWDQRDHRCKAHRLWHADLQE